MSVEVCSTFSQKILKMYVSSTAMLVKDEPELWFVVTCFSVGSQIVQKMQSLTMGGKDLSMDLVLLNLANLDTCFISSKFSKVWFKNQFELSLAVCIYLNFLQ